MLIRFTVVVNRVEQSFNGGLISLNGVLKVAATPIDRRTKIGLDGSAGRGPLLPTGMRGRERSTPRRSMDVATAHVAAI